MENPFESEVEKLYLRLKAAYTDNNLCRISSVLIESYRNNNIAYLHQVRDHLSSHICIESDEPNKLFSRLIMIYHPDRLEHYLKQMEQCREAGDLKKLEEYAHIIDVCQRPVKNDYYTSMDADIWSTMDVEFWYEEDDFDRIIDLKEGEAENFYDEQYSRPVRDILSVLKEKEKSQGEEIREYQLTYLQGELNLSNCGINDLFGIEYCLNLRALDLSENDLWDISPLGYLYGIEELYLSRNSVDSVKAFKTLNALRILDLSYNQINDISAIMDLPRLEFVNLLGNPVPEEQVFALRLSGIIVVF